MQSTPFNQAFMINIQFGAILSVVVLYYKRFFKSLDFYYKLFVAFIPAAILGYLFSDEIDAMLESVQVVAVALLMGGIIFLFIDKYFERKNPKVNHFDESKISFKQAFVIGIFQCVAMIPGVSRSAATIIGGLFQGMNKKSAAEFSFFLAVPTMFAASGYKLWKEHDAITSDTIGILLIGNMVAFIVAMAAIKFFINFLTKHGFLVFGYYRIVLGILLLVLIAAGIELNIV
jgi:undecaprenyl-diphosphatase